MRSRYYLLVIFFGIIALLWGAYLFSIQVLDPFNFAHMRRIRYTPNKDIVIPQRGSIYDSKGNLLVSSISYYQLDIDRSAVNRWADRNDHTQAEAFEDRTLDFGKYSLKQRMYRRLNRHRHLYTDLK